MHTLSQDVRYAARLLARSPAFTLVALLTLALGIAANTAIFSVVNSLLLRPLPYGEPERLVMLWQDQRERGGPEDEWLAPAHFFDWRSRSRSLEASTVFQGSAASLTGHGEPEQLTGWLVTADFFRVLRIAPVLGRDFRPEDDAPGAPPTVILTHGLWNRRFGADPALPGRTILLNREPHTVVGVLPSTYRSPFGAPEIFRPLRLNPVQASRGNVTLRMIARLRPDVSLEQARAELAAVGSALAIEHPEADKGATVRITRLHDEIAGDVRTPLLALFGAVLLVLLIASANVANLQLARASVRGREIAVRAALGASRGRIVRQLLTESGLLAVLGALGGVLLGSWMLGALLALAPEGTPGLADVRMDGRVLAFAILLALATSVIFGLVPALNGVRGDVAATIKEGGRSGAASHGVFLRSVLVVAELALALILITGAGLLIRSFANLRAVDPGFAPERVLTARLQLPANGYEKAPQVRTFYASLLERLETTPGIEAAGLVSVLPFSGMDTDASFRIEGRPEPQDPGDRPAAWYRIVSPGYLRALGMRLEAGRFIEPTDVDTVDKAVVINEALAARYWPGESPIGRRILTTDEAFTIVGIVGDVHHRTFREEPRGQMFLSYQQFTARQMTVVLRTAGEPTAALGALRRHVAALDPTLPVSSVSTMTALMADSLAMPRMMMLLMGGFAGASLLLAGIGIYGLMAYAVTLRTQEFGIRIALGAAGRDVLRLVLGQAARLALAGVVIGAAGAVATAHLVTTMLFGVTPSDLPTFAATAVLLGAIAVLAAYLPARRAVRVDPAAALRAE